MATAGSLYALIEVVDQARKYASQAKSANTRRAYQSDWIHFTAWCTAHGMAALPAAPTTVALYLTTLAQEYKTSTLQRRLTTIAQAHRAASYESPTQAAPVRAVWKGIRRTRGTAQNGKSPAVTADIRAMVTTLPNGLLGIRDRVLLLLGFAGAFRRSELVALDVSDLTFTREGLTVALRRSKTDQEGAGTKKGIPYGSHAETCPIRALHAWLEAVSIVTGPLFRPVNRHGQLQPGRLSDKAVALVVKRAAERAGLDPDRYAGHSLRAGLVTAAAAAGVSERTIMAQTGHRSVQMVRRYIRDGSLFRENAAASVGL
jgi:site-specific recombinase XerD